MITQTFDLNMIPESSPIIVHCDQYDTGTGRFIIKLYDGDIAYSPSGTAKIQGTKPDGKGFVYAVSLLGNTVTANLTDQMSPVAGDVRAQIIVTESSGRTGTFAFIIRVQKSALPDDTDLSESDYEYLESVIERAEAAAQDANNSADLAEAAADIASTKANNARDYSLDSEAHAIGKRNNIDVPNTDPTYNNNSKYYSQQAAGSVTSAEAVLADVEAAKDDALDAIEDALHENLPSFTVDFATGDLLYTGGSFVFTVDSAGDLEWAVA